MKQSLVTLNVVVLAVLATVVLRAEPAARAGSLVPGEPITLAGLPLQSYHSVCFDISSQPFEPSPIDGTGTRAIDAVMPPNQGLVLTHITAAIQNSARAYRVLIDGVLAHYGPSHEPLSNATVHPDDVQPILVRPGTHLRIEVPCQSNSIQVRVNVQGYVVTSNEIFGL